MSSQTPSLHGTVSDGFGPVADALAAAFERGEEIGAACAVFIDGRPVVDIHAGWRERKRQTPWDAATMSAVYSSLKAIVALLVAKAVDEGHFSYNDPVAAVWPEFAAAGKEAVTIAEAMSHQAGLSGFQEEMPRADWLDWNLITSRLAAMAPLWPVGSASGYHPQTYGFIAGELVRRATGQTLGEQMRALGPAPEEAVRTGLIDAEIAAVSDMTKPPRPPNLGDLNPFKEAAFLKPWSASGRPGDDAWRRAEIPAANGHATARGLARLMQGFATCRIDGEPFLSDAVRGQAMAERIAGDDLVLPFHLSWGAGLIRNEGLGIYGPSDKAVGHSGFGGACTFADPDAGLSFAYVTNKMSEHLIGDPRPGGLINALYSAL